MKLVGLGRILSEATTRCVPVSSAFRKGKSEPKSQSPKHSTVSTFALEPLEPYWNLSPRAQESEHEHSSTVWFLSQISTHSTFALSALRLSWMLSTLPDFPGVP